MLRATAPARNAAHFGETKGRKLAIHASTFVDDSSGRREAQPEAESPAEAGLVISFGLAKAAVGHLDVARRNEQVFRLLKPPLIRHPLCLLLGKSRRFGVAQVARLLQALVQESTTR
jgi:hypothetical protein